MTCQHPIESSILSGYETHWVMIGVHAHQRFLKDAEGRPLPIRYCGLCSCNVKRDGQTMRAHVQMNAPEGERV